MFPADVETVKAFRTPAERDRTRTMPKRQRYLWVCQNERPNTDPRGACGGEGAKELIEALKTAVSQAKLKDKVRVCGSSCLDLCWMRTAVAVMPDHVFYGEVTQADIPEIVQSLHDNTIVSRLVLGEADCDEKTSRARRTVPKTGEKKARVSS